MRNLDLKKIIDQRLAYILDSPYWENKLQMLIKQHIKENPSQSEEEAYEMIVQNMIYHYKDSVLDQLWLEYTQSDFSSESPQPNIVKELKKAI